MANDAEKLGHIIGNIIGGTIYGVALGGRKIYDKLTEEKKIYCPQCEKIIKESTKFCPNCGVQIH
jgi:rRNA maturation endonuclease Nob1